jgi:hypothetical protein
MILGPCLVTTSRCGSRFFSGVWAAAGFAWFARHMNIGRVVLAAIVMIVIVGIITNTVFALFGASVEIDGP